MCCAITQHLGTVFVFLAMFVRLKERSIDARILLWISVACSVLGYGTWEILHGSSPRSMLPNRVSRDTHCRLSLRSSFLGSKVFKSSLLVLLALMGLAPVLRTLTAATSSDSIWALSACLFLVNAVLADYSCTRPGSSTQERFAVSYFVKSVKSSQPTG